MSRVGGRGDCIVARKIGGAGAILLEDLMSVLGLGARVYRARLAGVEGYTGVGAFRYARSGEGSANYEVEAKGIAGLRAELFAHGEFVTTIDLKSGRAVAKFDSRLGDPEIFLEKGDVVEIRQNGCSIMAGALRA